jgi:hypothetical protein
MLYFRSGPWFKSEGAGQLPISPTMGRQLTPVRHEPRSHKDRVTAVVAAKDRGWRPIGRDMTARRQVVPRSRPRGSKSQGARQRRTAAWRSPAGSVPQDLTSGPIASESNKEPWDFDEDEQDFGEKRNPPKPHDSP